MRTLNAQMFNSWINPSRRDSRRDGPINHPLFQMKTSEIQSKVATIVAEQLGVEPSYLITSAPLRELGLDSLDLTEVLMTIEDEFRIDIDLLTEDTLSTTTIESITRQIANITPDPTPPPSWSEMVAKLVKSPHEIVETIHNDRTGVLLTALSINTRNIVRQAIYADCTKSSLVYGKDKDVRSYDGLAPSRFNNLTDHQAHLLHMALGLVGEAGEIMEAVLDYIATNKLDLPNCVEESGDLSFYHESFRQWVGFSRDNALAANFEKLSKRYKGHQYSDEAAIARADKEGDNGH